MLGGLPFWECCIAGDCSNGPVAWRWFPATRNPEWRSGWMPVCRRHATGRTSWPTPAQCELAGQPYRRPTAKPKGPTRTQLRRQCDDLFAEVIRAEGRCLAAGWGAFPCSERLQCAHIVSRKWLNTRWYLANAVCLCSAHHAFFTHSELDWEIWRDQEIGRWLYESDLRWRALQKSGPPDYQAILADLQMARAALHLEEAS